MTSSVSPTCPASQYAPSGQPMLEVSDLHVQYGNVRALKGVSCRILPGQAVAIVGPNGAGKSTLLRTISGLKHPRQGTIRFDGQAIERLKPHQISKSGLLQVPESREIFAGMTVWENLKVAFDNLNPAGDEAGSFQRIYALFPILGERRHTIAGNLSGGQQQMLAIARALLGNPKVLMLDEPSLGLARIIIKDIYDTLRQLRAQGITILLIEQNASLALDFADYSYVLVNGRIVLEGTREAVLEDDALVKHYLGAG